jgi:alpha-L-rhamnosidase
LFLLLPFGAFAQSLKVLNLQCEYKTNPLGIESAKPKLSWQLQSDARNVMQTAYRVLVADDAAKLASNNADIWDSGKVPSNASLQISCNGKPMQAAKTYYWKVMVWDNHGKASAWSNTASWQMGLLTKADWHGADWIAYDKLPDSSAIVPFYHGKGPKNWVRPMMFCR